MRILLFFISILFFASSAFSVCQDTGGTRGCPGGPSANWRYYDDFDDSLWGNNTCDSGQDCSCGVTDAGSPCGGCGWQIARSLGNCYADVGCSTPCTPVPEFRSNQARNIFILIGLVLTILSVQFSNRLRLFRLRRSA